MDKSYYKDIDFTQFKTFKEYLQSRALLGLTQGKSPREIAYDIYSETLTEAKQLTKDVCDCGQRHPR